jgi:type II secretory pathway component GspD/PulD (secretin)
MKLFLLPILSLGCGLWLAATAQPADPPADPDPSEASPPAADRLEAPPPAPPPAPVEESPEPPAPTADAPAALESPAPESAPAPTAAPASDRPTMPAKEAPAPAAPATPAASPATSAPAEIAGPPAKVVAEGERALRLNFRGAPLELVLNYLSEAAGFIIDLQTEVKGKVDVWSNQPLTKDEAVSVLNAVLSRNGYAAIRNERVLSIVSKDGVQKRDLPVMAGSDPKSIPRTEETVTQIIPVRFINATSLIKDLQPLLPSQTVMTANEGGNALVITDTQVNIRRMAEIVKALDTAISATSSIRVFPLKYADARALATVVTALFPAQDTAGRGGNNAMQQFFRGMRGGDPGASAASTGNARVATPRVVATADERSNSLVVSAPEEQMAIVVDLVAQVDMNVDDVTELQVFRLKYADPQETADMLTTLFPDPTTSQSGRNQMQFGGGRFGGFGGQQNNQSTRLIKQSRVLAVPDLRTGSIVVSASRELMAQIIPVVEALDSDPRRKQKVFVMDVENTDPQTVQNIVQNLFPSQNTRSSTYNQNNNQRAGNQLNNRAASSSTQNQNLRSSTSTQSRGVTGN